MPSNKDLIENINKVATEKGVEVPNTVGLNNDKLNETLKGLRALEAKPAESTEESEDLVPGSDDTESTDTVETKADPQAAAKEAAQAKIDAADKRKEDAKTAAKAKRDALPPYRIAEGKSLVCLKGSLGPGDEVKVKYFAGGKDDLERHIDSGFVIKK